MIGNWEIAERVLEKFPEYAKAYINEQGETALHIATAANHPRFVEQLVNKNKQCLYIGTCTGENGDKGNTAFFYAAASGNVKIAQLMLKKDSNLAMIPRRQNVLPIHTAALLGHGKMVRWLYKETKSKLHTKQNKDLISLLVALIDSDIHDIAMDLVKAKPGLATEKDRKNETALHAFARKLRNDKPATPCSPWMKLYLNIFSGRKNQMGKEAIELYKLIWKKILLLDDEQISELMMGDSNRLTFIAAKQGNDEFLTTLISSYPTLAFKANKKGYTIFHIAILYRQMKVFKLIHGIGSFKYFMNIKKDKEGNNMLHLAGKLAASSRQNTVPGAALQLQRDLFFFEKVKEVVLPQQIEEKNKKGKSPRYIFIEQHTEMRKDGEEWMRNTAHSCMVVATLIATVVFAAAFTVPGGNGQVNGIPILVNQNWFKIFAISDAISLISSASSILSFLSILASRYSVDDFRISLPTKLTFGLFFLFIAILTMMVAFVATFFIIFKHGLSRFAFPIAGIAVFPVLLFLFLHFGLFLEVICSTYMFFMLFRRNKNTLFSRRPSKHAEIRKSA
ncbi:ankyrin repeat-containing protein NPR4-like [Hevea brasiliensis]|uniref:ankyrin repeat-containing protein NPR4-like n=1 Tax=Hevea brasiliensis TaxID=3981 RepID=UPI0025E22FE8|nr:ankyrin repeat-containing protein NPR4-like [Hevea brasiliensis]